MHRPFAFLVLLALGSAARPATAGPRTVLRRLLCREQLTPVVTTEPQAFDSRQRARVLTSRAVEMAPALFAAAREAPWLADAIVAPPSGRGAGETERFLQDVLDARQARAPAAKALTERLVRGELFDRIFIATHVPTRDQARAATVVDDLRFAGMPRLILVNESLAFHLVVDEFHRASDLTLFSRGGELIRPFAAREVFLIGGDATMCLRQTIRDLSNRAIPRGLSSLKIHVLVDHVYPSKQESLKSLRDDLDVEPSRRKLILFNSFPDWNFDPDGFRRERGKLIGRATSVEAPGFGLNLILE